MDLKAVGVPSTAARLLESLSVKAGVGSKRIRPEWRDKGIYYRAYVNDM